MTKTRQLELIEFRTVMPQGEVLAFESPRVPYQARTKKSNQLIRAGISANISRYSYLLLQITAIKFCREIDRRMNAVMEQRAEMNLPVTPQEFEAAAKDAARIRASVAASIDWVAISVDELRAFPSLSGVSNLTLRVQAAAEELRKKFEYVKYGINQGEDGFGGSVIVNWAYDSKSSTIAFELNRWLRHMLYEVGSEYTVISAETMATLGSFRAQRFYEIFSSYLVKEEKGQTIRCKFTIDELRVMLGVEPKQYLTPNAFKRRAIEEPIADVNEHTGLEVHVTTVFKNRETVGYEFIARQREEADPLTPVEAAIADQLDKRQVSAVAARELARHHDPITVIEAIAQVEAYVAKSEERDRKAGVTPAARTIGSKTGLLVAAIRRGRSLRYGSTELINKLKGDMVTFCWERGGLPSAQREPFVDKLLARFDAVSRIESKMQADSLRRFRDPLHPMVRTYAWDLLLDEHYGVRGRPQRKIERSVEVRKAVE